LFGRDSFDRQSLSLREPVQISACADSRPYEAGIALHWNLSQIESRSTHGL